MLDKSTTEYFTEDKWKEIKSTIDTWENIDAVKVKVQAEISSHLYKGLTLRLLGALAFSPILFYYILQTQLMIFGADFENIIKDSFGGYVFMFFQFIGGNIPALLSIVGGSFALSYFVFLPTYSSTKGNSYHKIEKSKYFNSLSLFDDCQQGNYTSLRQLLVFYKTSATSPKSGEVIFSLTALLAELNDKDACLSLAYMFKNGHYVAQSNDQYYIFLKRADELGSYDAMKELVELRTPEQSSGSILMPLAAGILIGNALSSK